MSSGKSPGSVSMAIAMLALAGCGDAQPAPRTAQAPASTAQDEVPGPKADWYTQHHGVARKPCGDGCRFATHHHSEVSLFLGPHGKAEATDHGERLEESATVVGDNARITRWVRRWSGSWSEGQGVIHVSLEPNEVSCERITKDGATDNPCSAQPLKLVCEHATVKVSQPRAQMLPGWVCLPERRMRLTELTPLPWVFGEEQWLLALERGFKPRRSRARREYAIGDLNDYPRHPRHRH